MKVSLVVYRTVLAKGYIEFTALIEAAETMKASAIQVVEKLCCVTGLCPAVVNQPVEARAMCIEKFRVVARLDLQRKSTTNLRVEINQVGIQIIQRCALWLQTQRDRQPTAKRLDITAMLVWAPERFDVGHQPTLPASPFQQRL